jgi:glycerol uptake facilitator-like aquaporin
MAFPKMQFSDVGQQLGYPCFQNKPMDMASSAGAGMWVEAPNIPTIQGQALSEIFSEITLVLLLLFLQNKKYKKHSLPLLLNHP